jgi:hypothetical protein
VVDHVLRHNPFERSRVSGREGGDELAGNVFVLFEHPILSLDVGARCTRRLYARRSSNWCGWAKGQPEP